MKMFVKYAGQDVWSEEQERFQTAEVHSAGPASSHPTRKNSKTGETGVS